ncbi:hypothetical protein [Candidatus Clostridium radicumherbarum]|uniref:Serine protease n=1 Tax=Candidatus Clostridium radicumherbarum TaxID=3381662 RepID=A0ABW8TV31_9CLOT
MSVIKIKQLAVLIRNENGAIIGSGTLFVPRGDGLHAYIYTASHVIMHNERVEKKLKFKMLVDDEEVDFETDVEDSIKCHDSYDKNSDIKEYDVAVIKVLKKDWMKNLPTLTIGKPKENENINGQGYPISAHEEKLQFAMLPLNGVIRTCSDKYMRSQLQLSNELNPMEHDEELKGYSGAGVYEVSGDQTDPVLLGIFSFGQGQQAVQKLTNIFYSDLLRDICKKNGWEEPEDALQLPGSFEPYAYGATRIIENENTRNQIKDLIDYFIKIGIKPSDLIDSKDSLHDIPRCNNKDRTRCEACWTARLQLISILAILRVKIEEFNDPQIDINTHRIPIDFFCSEGSEGESKIAEVVRSIVDKEYVLGGKFRENAILVWASLDKQNTKVMKRSEFNNVVRDICGEEVTYRLKGYDTLYGESGTNNLSIIHIDELMKVLDAKDIESSTNNLLEVLRDVIR